MNFGLKAKKAVVEFAYWPSVLSYINQHLQTCKKYWEPSWKKLHPLKKLISLFYIISKKNNKNKNIAFNIP